MTDPSVRSGANGMHAIHNDPIRHYPHLIEMLAWHLAVKLMRREAHARAYLTSHRAELIEATIRMVRADPEFLILGEQLGRPDWPDPAHPRNRWVTG